MLALQVSCPSGRAAASGRPHRLIRILQPQAGLAVSDWPCSLRQAVHPSACNCSLQPGTGSAAPGWPSSVTLAVQSHTHLSASSKLCSVKLALPMHGLRAGQSAIRAHDAFCKARCVALLVYPFGHTMAVLRGVWPVPGQPGGRPATRARQPGGRTRAASRPARWGGQLFELTS